MARTQATPGLSVFQIFNLCQKSLSAHKKCAGLLWTLEQQDSQQCLQNILQCLQHVLLMPTVDLSGERIVRFVTTFLADKDVTRTADCDAFAEKLLKFLVKLVTAKDKAVRTRCCQLVQVIFNHLCADELDADLLDDMQDMLLLRLQDKVPAVRVQAVQGLPRLCDPGDEGDFADCPVLKGFLQLLRTDKSKDVRKIVLAHLPACNTMVIKIVGHTRDVSDQLRRTAYALLGQKVDISYLSVDQRVQLLREGLEERVESVKANALFMLQIWLRESCNNDIKMLLNLIHVEDHPDVAELAMKELIQAAVIDPAALAHAAGEQQVGLHQPNDAEPLTAGDALLWRLICQYLHESGRNRSQAAAASSGAPSAVATAAAEDFLKALEAALPTTVKDMIGLVAAHANAGQQHTFATCQLLQIAASCLDMGDATGRQAAAQLVDQLLHEPFRFQSTDQSLERALMALAQNVHAELADAMLSTLWGMFEGWGLANKAATPATEGQSPDSDMQAADDDNTASGSFQDVLQQASNVREQNQHWAHCLKVASLLLQHLPTARLRTAGAGQFQSIDDLWQRLILPGLGHAVDAVRLEAMHALGLYCLLEGILRPVGQLAALRAGLVWQSPQAEGAAAAEETAIRCVAAKALCDWVLIRGPKAGDGWYINTTPATQDLQASPPNSPGQQQENKPLLDLLLTVLQQTVQSDADKGVDNRYEEEQAEQRAGEGENLASILAEGLAKALLHAHLWSTFPERCLQEAERAKALATLLVIHVHPATQDKTRLRQCLSVFFPAYAMASSSNKHDIARAFRRAARGALRAGPLKKSPAPQLMRYMLHLLHLTPAGKDKGVESDAGMDAADSEPHSVRANQQQQQRDSFPLLAAELLSEVAECTRFKESKLYLAGVLKVLLVLPLDSHDVAAIKQLRALAGQTAVLLKDKVAEKDLATFCKQLQQLDPTPEEVLDAESLTALMASVNLHSAAAQTPDKAKAQGQSRLDAAHNHEASSSQAESDQHEMEQANVGQPVLATATGQGILADCPLPFTAEADSVTATPIRGRRPPRRAVAKSPDAAGKEMLPSTAMRRQMPARSARTTKKLSDAISSSSQSDAGASSTSDESD